MKENMNRSSTLHRFARLELHLHLDGSLSLDNVRQLAALQGIALPPEPALRQMLCVDRGCRSLNDYLEKFEFPGMLLQTEQAIMLAVRTLAKELLAHGLWYAELRFAPQLHTKRGLTQERVVCAAREGLRQSGLCGSLILCCMRDKDNLAQNRETLRVARKYLEKGVCAVDLAGAEALFPTASFGELFAIAREADIPFTIHAGEAAGAESIRTAIAFGARRIGHGVRLLEDPALTAQVADSGIALELCPTSNLNTCVFESISQFPLRELMSRGVAVTINTDNRTVSDVTLASEYRMLTDAFSLTERELCQLTENSIAAAFADEATKKALRARLAGGAQ